MVHLVAPGYRLGTSDDHFMKDIFESSNMGQKNVLDKRSGPFRTEKGRSRVMSRSANVTIRKRRMQIEISVRKNVTEHEMSTLHAKLGAHATSSPVCIVYLIERNIRKKLGAIGEIDLEKLMNMIRGILKRRGTIGILLVDTHFGGALHKRHIHRSKFNRNTYFNKTIHHTHL